ncbi:MAG: hypothetical protein H0X26_10205 [Alphaproteobacteria bacterium]|nr:hypothetical protein [Alphaproteobacteria bacterium]
MKSPREDLIFSKGTCWIYSYSLAVDYWAYPSNAMLPSYNSSNSSAVRHHLITPSAFLWFQLPIDTLALARVSELHSPQQILTI